MEWLASRRAVIVPGVMKGLILTTVNEFLQRMKER